MSGPSANLSLWTTVRRHLNFFRIHLLFFTLTPLIFSVVLYASNGRYPIAYVDALYNSVSALTVCGLGTVNLSQLTPWQQVLLFTQMCVGNPVVVSWFMVYTRRLFFARKFKYIIQAEAARRTTPPPLAESSVRATGTRTFAWRVTSFFRHRDRPSPVVEASASENGSSAPRRKEVHRNLQTDMIHRMDAPPKRVDPSGWVSEGPTTPLKRVSSLIGQDTGQAAKRPSSPVEIDHLTDLASSIERVNAPGKDAELQLPRGRPMSGNDAATIVLSAGTRPASFSESLLDNGILDGTGGSPHLSPPSAGVPRATAVEFAPTVTRHHVPLPSVSSTHSNSARNRSIDDRPRGQISRNSLHSRRSSGVMSRVSLMRNPSLPPSLSMPIIEHADSELAQARASQRDFGGFPMPLKLLGMLFCRLFPATAKRLRTSLTIPISTTLAGGELGRTASITGDVGNLPEGSKAVPYISFDAIVGRNSTFHMLTNEQLEELGGVEYRALNALLWLVAAYHFGTQVVAFVVIAPYMTLPKWAPDFVPPALIRPVATPWFSLFQVISSYTNTGFSLVDQSMIPFQTAYPMIFFMVFLILAGNTAFPIFLRFMIWTIAKLVPTTSHLYETLHFLLDHPRRCFVYLFPAHQTWFLLGVLALINFLDFFCLMVLDIGNPSIESIPFGTRFAAGILQATDVRAGGFAIVPIAALAPAVKVMYVIAMYISVYPIAMSVRSTNVYEEQSLGIFHSDDPLPAEQAFKANGSRMAMWGRYLAMHARHQLSFDMWWLALALFLICIIEGDNLINPLNQGWFNIFSILFEIVSAYGSVGLSLGIPTQNYSLSGAFRPLSKLIVCLVMIRGRHRGLPVAIDRAVVLPYEFERVQGNLDPPVGVNERQSSRYNNDTASCPRGAHNAEHGQAIAEKERVRDEVPSEVRGG